MQIEENTVHVRVSSLIVRTPIRNILVYSEQLFYTRPSTSFSGHFLGYINMIFTMHEKSCDIGGLSVF